MNNQSFCLFFQQSFQIFLFLQQYSFLEMEQNKQITLERRYNLFSSGASIDIGRGYKGNSKQKRQIKLIFHHPNLLFLNSKKVRSKQEASKEVGEAIVRNIKTRAKKQRYNNIDRPYTSHQSNYDLDMENNRNKTVFTPYLKRSTTQQALQIFGKSSNDAQASINKPVKHKISHQKEKYYSQTGSEFEKKDENIFNILQSKQGDAKKEAWMGLISSNKIKHAVRLNIYLDVEKKYLKYVSKCR